MCYLVLGFPSHTYINFSPHIFIYFLTYKKPNYPYPQKSTNNLNSGTNNSGSYYFLKIIYNMQEVKI